MFWRKKNKKDFQLYEEELNHIQDLIEHKDEDDSDLEDGDLMIDLADDMADDYDQEEVLLSDDPDLAPGDSSSKTGQEGKGKVNLLKKLFSRKKKLPEEAPVYLMDEEFEELSYFMVNG